MWTYHRGLVDKETFIECRNRDACNTVISAREIVLTANKYIYISDNWQWRACRATVGKAAHWQR